VTNKSHQDLIASSLAAGTTPGRTRKRKPDPIALAKRALKEGLPVSGIKTALDGSLTLMLDKRDDPVAGNPTADDFNEWDDVLQ
jgi:hypothetical protein